MAMTITDTMHFSSSYDKIAHKHVYPEIDDADITGTAYFASGAKAVSCTVSSGGKLIISGGSAFSSFVKSGGKQIISYGYASNAVISAGGQQQILSGAIAYTTIASGKGATEYVYGNAYGTELQAGASQIVFSRGYANPDISSGGTQIVSSGGSAYITYIYGTQVIKSKGETTSTYIFGVQHVSKGGIARDVSTNGGSQIISYGGSAIGGMFLQTQQHILSGGIASNATFYSANQLVSSGGSAKETILKNNATQCIESGGVAIDTSVDEYGKLIISGGGSALNTRVLSNGSLTILSNGYASGGTVSAGGIYTVDKGGKVYDIKVDSGAETHIADGAIIDGWDTYGRQFVSGSSYNERITGSQIILKKGKAYSAIISKGGRQIISSGGSAISTVVSSGGLQNVAGLAQKTTISKGGKVQVTKGGIASAASILTGGGMTISKGGIARVVTVASTGSLTAKDGAVVSAVTLKKGAKLTLAAGNALGGKNTFTGATVTGGTTAKRVSLAKKATLSVGTDATMKKLHLNASNASISITGTGDTLGSLKTNKSTTISYDVSKVAAKSTAYMLSLSTKNTQKLGSFSITVKKNQGVGTYELSKNIVQKNTKYIINQASTKQGTATLNGLGLIKGTAIYTVQSASNNISLTVAKTGNTHKGTDKVDKLSGTANCDIFYGGKGNDTITGKNGRDVAVYDSTAWGKDVIAKTNGTMTLLFNGLKAKDIVQEVSGSTLTITKKKDTKQSITVNGWSDSTHNIVYASGMTAFNKYIKAAKPSTAQTTAARNEAFKKAGLASA